MLHRSGCGGSRWLAVIDAHGRHDGCRLLFLLCDGGRVHYGSRQFLLLLSDESIGADVVRDNARALIFREPLRVCLRHSSGRCILSS